MTLGAPPKNEIRNASKSQNRAQRPFPRGLQQFHRFRHFLTFDLFLNFSEKILRQFFRLIS
jgi:hypothetical protein